MPTRKRSCRFTCIKLKGVLQEQSKRPSFGSRSAFTGFAKRADILFQKPGWTPFPGHGSAASARSERTLEDGLGASSVLTRRNARAAKCNGNLARELTKMSAR